MFDLIMLQRVVKTLVNQALETAHKKIRIMRLDLICKSHKMWFQDSLIFHKNRYFHFQDHSQLKNILFDKLRIPHNSQIHVKN